MPTQLAVLGKPGPLALQALSAGAEVFVKTDPDNRAPRGFREVSDYQELWELIAYPRLFLLENAQLAQIDEIIDTAYLTMEPGDVVADFTQSYWGDTLRRFRRMRHRSIFYVDGSVIHGADRDTLVVSGDENGVEIALAVLRSLHPADQVHGAGQAGSAHFAAMLGDACDRAQDQIASECRALLEAFPNAAASNTLFPLLMRGCSTGEIETSAGSISDWLLDDAVHLQMPIPMLANAIMRSIEERLEALEERAPLRRIGGFVHPDDIL